MNCNFNRIITIQRNVSKELFSSFVVVVVVVEFGLSMNLTNKKKRFELNSTENSRKNASKVMNNY
jgi:hypothetical protein